MVVLGLTHCRKCWQELDDEIELCKSCRKSEEMEKKTMKFSEAMALLENGKKVRKTIWTKDGYIYKNNDENIVEETGKTIDTFTFTIDGEWEEYIEEDKDINAHSKIKKLEWNRFNTTDKIFKKLVFNTLNEIIDKLNKI